MPDANLAKVNSGVPAEVLQPGVTAPVSQPAASAMPATAGFEVATTPKRNPTTIVMAIVLAAAVVALAVMLLLLLMPTHSAKTETALQEAQPTETGRVGGPGDAIASAPDEQPEETEERKTADDDDWARHGRAELPPVRNGITGASDSSDALSSREAYKKLVAFLDGAESLDKQVADCAADFNADYLSKSTDDRKAKANRASTLKSQVKRKWDEVADLDMPFWSPNYDEWGDVCELYECLWHRIDVIDRAWTISLKYDEPEKHKDEILAPIVADQTDGQNKYYLRYKELYPTIELENA